jgi:hypothetical protein
MDLPLTGVAVYVGDTIEVATTGIDHQHRLLELNGGGIVRVG